MAASAKLQQDDLNTQIYGVRVFGARGAGLSSLTQVNVEEDALMKLRIAVVATKGALRGHLSKAASDALRAHALKLLAEAS